MVGRLQERMSANCHYVRGRPPSTASILGQSALGAVRRSGDTFSLSDRLLSRTVERRNATNENQSRTGRINHG